MGEGEKDKKTIYDTSYKSIFAKNFIAGFSKGLGIIMAYVFLGGIIYYLAITYVLPKFNNFLSDNIPIFESLTDPTKTFRGQDQPQFTSDQIEKFSETLE